MQRRPYDNQDGQRIWLSRDEQADLLDSVEDRPRRRIAIQLGLHGLRTDEIVNVRPDHIRPIDDENSVLTVPSGKTGKREVPIENDLTERIGYLKAADSQLNATDEIIDVSKRSVRNWMEDARDELGDDYDELGMHDLRRSWATDTYYSLAMDGNPIAEELVMSWGGWKMTATGRETFRQNYLGPIPDHVTAAALDSLHESPPR